MMLVLQITKYLIIDLDRDLKFNEILSTNATDFVVSVRETGDNPHYAIRIANALCSNVDANKLNVILYGQTARLKLLQDAGKIDSKIKLCLYDEYHLARMLNIKTTGKTYENGLVLTPYIFEIPLPKEREKYISGTIETTRGCPHTCSFCYITAGQNYPKRWVLKDNDHIIADIKKYTERGIFTLNFNDSEFFGPGNKQHKNKVFLLNRIINELPRIKFTILCRADNLVKFNEFALLKKAGLQKVFIGVESFSQDDLDSVNKKIAIDSIDKAIMNLKKYDIFCRLSYITFNRNTNVETIRKNLSHLKKIYSTKPHILGLPFFTFSTENDWLGVGSHFLSDRTYVDLDRIMKEQPSSNVLYNTTLEPLMEIYRLLTYEWVKKVTSLNLYIAGDADDKEKDVISSWINNTLPVLCINIMEEFLEKFASKSLTLSTLINEKEILFKIIYTAYQKLPAKCRNTEIYHNHAKKLSYNEYQQKLETEEYWYGYIPA